MPWGVVAGAVIGAVGSSIASGNAASAQENAANTASNTQLSMFNTIQQNEAPWVSTGSQANAALAAFYGLPGGSAGVSTGTPGYDPSSGYRMGPGGTISRGLPGGSAASQAPAASAPDYTKILSNLPGYQFQQQQGQLATERNLAANGLLDSGAAQKSLTQFGQGLASNYAAQYTQGLQNLSQMGQAGASGVATAGMNAANQIGSNQIYAGNAAAAGTANTWNGISSSIGGLAGLAGYQNAPWNSSGYSPSATNAISQQGTDYIGSNMDYSIGGLP